MIYWNRCIECRDPVVSREEVKCCRCQAHPKARTYKVSLKKIRDGISIGTVIKNDPYNGHIHIVTGDDGALKVENALLSGQFVRFGKDGHLID